MAPGTGGAHVGRRGVLFAAALAILGSTIPTSASGESGFSAPITLRNVDAWVVLADIAASGQDVSVIWEEDTHVDQHLRVRTSGDAGRTFASQRLVESRPSLDDGRVWQARTDVCAGHAWIAHDSRQPGDPADRYGLVVHGFALQGSGTSSERIVHSGASQDVRALDFACAGERRRVVAWEDNDLEGPSTVHLRFLPILPDAGATVVNASFTANIESSLALAAVADRAWVAWVTPRGRIRVKPFAIGPAPDFEVTPRAAVTLPKTPRPFPTGLALAATPSRLLIAYSVSMRFETATGFTQISTDDGATFRARRRLAVAEYWMPFVAEIKSSQAVVNGSEETGMEFQFELPRRFRSSDGGRSWSRKYLRGNGQRMGAFTGKAKGARLVEAWDQSSADRDRYGLRVHRELD